MTSPRFVKLVGSPLDGLYVKQEQHLGMIVIGFVQGWGECRYKVSLCDDGEWNTPCSPLSSFGWVGVFVED